METLCEIRIFVPNEEREGDEGAAAADGDDVKMKTEGGEEKADGEDKDGEEGDEDEDETEEETAAQVRRTTAHTRQFHIIQLISVQLHMMHTRQHEDLNP